MEDLRQAAEHANVAITAASHSLQRADRYLAQLYSERLREVGRRCALVAGCPRSAATLLFDERQRGAEFEGLVVPPLGALTLKCTRDTRRLLPFASLHDLDFIFIHRADLVLTYLFSFFYHWGFGGLPAGIGAAQRCASSQTPQTHKIHG